jgi:Ser/Thr protein kinase RdoA (MazF antagonist)
MSPSSHPPHPYQALTPDCVLDALEHLGIRTDGSLLALNSYENRVYQVGTDEGPPLIAKFYRPSRWSDQQIDEEHRFAEQLVAAEIPVVAPLHFNGQSLHGHQGFRFAVFPRRGGRSPELDIVEVRTWIGRFLGRIHVVGQSEPFTVRPGLDIESFGVDSLREVLASGRIPMELETVYRGVAQQALDGVRRCYDRAGLLDTLRLHGDCHASNILWTDAGPHFVDLDDARSGPAVQDLWMLLSGDRAEQTRQLADIVDGYEDFREFDRRELHLVEALRTLRLLHYSAWLARRWDDPAFPAAFPWFDTPRYWEQKILELREQIAIMDEPPLAV